MILMLALQLCVPHANLRQMVFFHFAESGSSGKRLKMRLCNHSCPARQFSRALIYMSRHTGKKTLTEITSFGKPFVLRLPMHTPGHGMGIVDAWFIWIASSVEVFKRRYRKLAFRQWSIKQFTERYYCARPMNRTPDSMSISISVYGIKLV